MKLAVGGLQAGKSFSAAMELLSRAWPWARILWIVAPSYEDARPEMRYLADAYDRLGLIVKRLTPNSPGPWELHLQGGTVIRTISATDVERLAREAPDGILMVEAARQPESAFQRCMARVVPKGGWLCVNGTLVRGSWFGRVAKQWQAPNPAGARTFKIPAWSNRAFYPGGARDPKIRQAKATLSAREFKEQLAGEEVPAEGLVLKAFDVERHCFLVQWGGEPPAVDAPLRTRTLWLPADQEFEIWVDPGISGSAYAVYCGAKVHGSLVTVAEVYLRDYTAPKVIDYCMTQPWWPNVRRGVIDVAGTYRSMGLESNQSVWKDKTGLHLTADQKKVPIQVGIDRLDWLLQTNHLETGLPLWIVNGAACPHLVYEATEGYKWPENRHGTRALGDHVVPVDAHCDGIKAHVYAAMHHYPLIGRERRGGIKVAYHRPVWR
jgi:hypothetical protein